MLAPFYDAATWALRRVDPETAHTLGLRLLRAGLAPRARADRHAVLATEALGLTFPNPLGLAAGFDKNAEAPDALLAAGFGFVEVGTVTPRPQPGNPRPRVFRLPADGAVINRYGFNNDGLEAVQRRLAARLEAGRTGIVGANVGANKDSPDRVADYVTGLRTLHGLARYFTINVSSPNTPGLRDLQGREALERLLDRLVDARAQITPGGAAPVPMLLKIAPDLTEADQDDIAAAVGARPIDGLIVSNTTVARPHTLRSPAKAEAGGLSGRPLFEMSTDLLRAMRVRLPADRLIIGVGGIMGGQDAAAKRAAGATLTQVYTGLVYTGLHRLPAWLDAMARAQSGPKPGFSI